MMHRRRGPDRGDAGDPRARRRTAFVLSGGGNQGVAQVGMLRALVERGIVPDVVIGTSAGALNGAAIAYAPNLTGIDRLASVWSALTTDDVFPGGRISRAWKVVRRGTHLFTSEGLSRVITESTPARSFADLVLPLRVVASDLDSGEEVVLTCGPLEPALLASAALPGVFPIVHHDGRRLVDGGVVNSVPLWHALSGPIDRVFVLNVSHGVADRVPRSPLDVVMTSFAHSRNMRYELERRYAPDHVEIVELPRPNDPRDLFDFAGAEDLIERAYTLSAAALDDYLEGRVASTSEDHRRNHRLRIRWARRQREPEPLVVPSG
jgi:NTE family protein